MCGQSIHLETISQRYHDGCFKDASAKALALSYPHNRTLYPQDIFIPKQRTKNGVDGDRVEVLVNQEVISEKGPEGKILAILSRARTHIGGNHPVLDREGCLTAHAPMLGSQQRVVVEPSEEQPLRAGDRIVMEVIDWDPKETESVCRFSHYLGHISDPSCDIFAAIEEFELRADFQALRLKRQRNWEDSLSERYQGTGGLARLGVCHHRS